MALSASAQDEEEAAEGGPAEEEEEAPRLPTLAGDVVTLTTGQVLSGVQVLRGTPKFYEVEIIKGIEPVRILRRQVKSIEWDDIDPLRDRLRRKLMPDEPQSTVVSAEQLAPEMRTKITASLGDQEKVFKDRGVIEILEELSKKAGVTIEIDESIQNIPDGERIWDLTIASGVSLFTILQDELPKAFPNLRLDFQFDKVVVLSREEAVAAPETSDAASPQL